MRVAVIDTGINARHRAIAGRVNGYVSISRGPTGFAYDDQPHEDTIGHGTACAGIIRSLAPECEIYSVRVIGPDGTGDASVLAAGLKWAVQHGMHICNLSLGAPSSTAGAVLREIADEAYFRNMMLVAAANNVPEPSFPWMFSSVISVASSASTDPYVFYTNPHPPAEFAAAGVDVPIPWLAGWTTATGNSFAAAYMTGVITRIAAKHPQLTVPEMKVLLRALAANASTARADVGR